MAGVNVETGGGGGRRASDTEINMIPMIDLLMVTISFLLITAVWTHMARVDATAQVPGPPGPTTPKALEKELHVEMRNPDKFTLVWKQGATVVETTDVPSHPVVQVDGALRTVRYPDLAARIAEEWKTNGSHRALSDGERDRAVLHTGAETPYASLIAVMDAVYQTHRERAVGGRVESVPAFRASFSVD